MRSDSSPIARSTDLSERISAFRDGTRYYEHVPEEYIQDQCCSRREMLVVVAEDRAVVTAGSREVGAAWFDEA